MDIGKSFTYMFDDEDWLKKIIIGAVLHIVPVVDFIPMGYSLRTLKNVAEASEKPLPEWDDWGEDFKKGLMLAVAWLIYSLPIIVIQILTAVVGAFATSGRSSDVASICLTGITCLWVLWAIAEALWLPAAMLKYAMEGEFGSFFKFDEIWQFIRDNLTNYIVAILLVIAALIVASVVGGVACGIGVFITSFWATLVAAHLFGQLQAESASPGGISDIEAPEISDSPS